MDDNEREKMRDLLEKTAVALPNAGLIPGDIYIGKSGGEYTLMVNLPHEIAALLGACIAGGDEGVGVTVTVKVPAGPEDQCVCKEHEAFIVLAGDKGAVTARLARLTHTPEDERKKIDVTDVKGLPS